MSRGPDWEGILPQNLYLFLKEYRGSIHFTYSTPVSSFFWISSTIPNTVTIPVIGSAIPYAFLVGLALLSLIGPMTLYWHQNKPFHVVIDWNPIEPESIDHRLEHKNLLRLRDFEDREDPVALTHINAYFDKDIEEYRLRLDPTGPLSVKPRFAPGNSEYKSDKNLIVCNDVRNHDVYFPLEIIEEGDQQGVLKPQLYIKDSLNDDSELLAIEVI